MNIIVIGGGAMGCGIAAGFVARGADVVLMGRDPARCEASQREALALAADIESPIPHGTLRAAVQDGFDAWSAATLVIETVKENVELKQALFAQLDMLVPANVPIGSNSSGIPISKIAQGLATRSRMFNTHYFMPAHLVPLVEVVLGADSDPKLALELAQIFTDIGKKPVIVKRDIPGFLANRLQHALMREVLSLIDAGIASTEDIDMAVRYSFGFRYAAIGPVLQKEISGWDAVYGAAREIYPTLSNIGEPPECLARLMREGRLGMKSGAGFIAWTPETAAAVREGYEERLRAAMRLLD